MKASIASSHTQISTADLELVLALIRGRTLQGAAQQLKVDGSTVFRAIRRLERQLGEALFDRGRQGYVPTGLALELGAHAERIELQLQEARDKLRHAAGGPSGVLRVTTTDTILHGLLMPLLPRFAADYPGIELELVVSNVLADLNRRDADVAIRATRTPPGHLIGIKLGVLRAAVYASSALLARGATYPDGLDWIALDDSLPDHPSQAWRRQRYPTLAPRHRANSVLSVGRGIVHGLGAGVVPLFLMHDEPGVRIVEGPLDALDTDLWCLAHPDARQLQRVKVWFDFLRAHVQLPAAETPLQQLGDQLSPS